MVIDGEMPGSAPPRMPQATPPKAANTREKSGRDDSVSIIALEERLPDTGGLRNAQQQHEERPEHDGTTAADKGETYCQCTPLPQRAREYQRCKGGHVAEPRHDQ